MFSEISFKKWCSFNNTMHKDFCFLATINSFDYLTNSLLLNIQKGILLSWFHF